MTQRKAPTPFCTDHCGGCNRCFHGLAAFDAHRAEGTCMDPEVVTRTRRDGSAQPALQIWTNEGSCRLGHGCYENGVLVRVNSPVVIFQVYQSEAQQLSLARLRS